MSFEIREDLTPEIGYFVHRKCTPEWMLIEEKIDSIDIVYVLDGAATYTIENQRYHLKQGNLLCVPRGSLRSAYTCQSELMECYSVSFQFFDMQGAEGFLPLPVVNHIGVQPNLISMFGDLNSSWLQRNPGYIIKSRAVLMLIILKLYELILFKEVPIVTDARISKAVRFITDNYFKDMDINSVAKVTGLHPSYFGELFKNSTGLSFRAFLTEIRLNSAENLLKSGLHNITEVSIRCGFSDVCYFSRVYKKSRGISPSKVIRQ